MSGQLELHVGTGETPKARRNGPVYQGVAATVRRLRELEIVEDGTDKRGRHDGLVAQAFSLANSIDRESGHWPELRQASGVSLSALHAQLTAILQALDPDDAGEASGGPLGELVERWAREDAARS